MKKRFRLLLCLIAVLAVFFTAPAFSVLADSSLQAESMRFSVTNYHFVPGLQAVVPTEGNQFLSVNLTVKPLSGSLGDVNPQMLLYAVDEKGRVYAPLLFNGASSFTATLEPGETAQRVLFEVPDAAGSYRLVVLNSLKGEAAGFIELGKSVGTSLPEEGEPIAVVTAEGYAAAIHAVSQSKKAYLDEAPEGMKYVWVDVTFSGEGYESSVAQLASQWVVYAGDQAFTGIVPTRAGNLLLLSDLHLNDLIPSIRGKLCYLVPEEWTELTGLTAGGTTIASLPIGGDLYKNVAAASFNADGSYSQAGWKVTIQGIRFADKGSLADPPKGMRYVIVNLTVTNQSTQNLTVSSELAFALTDDKGRELTQAWFADLSDTMDAQLLPSESVTGEVAFLLDDEAASGTFRVHFNMMGEPLLIDTADYLTK